MKNHTRIIYVCELDEPHGENHLASLYIGTTNNIERRMQEHATKRGAAFLAAAVDRGIAWRIVHLEFGDYEAELKIKAWKATRKYIQSKQAQSKRITGGVLASYYEKQFNFQEAES